MAALRATAPTPSWVTWHSLYNPPPFPSRPTSRHQATGGRRLSASTVPEGPVTASASGMTLNQSLRRLTRSSSGPAGCCEHVGVCECDPSRQPRQTGRETLFVAPSGFLLLLPPLVSPVCCPVLFPPFGAPLCCPFFCCPLLMSPFFAAINSKPFMGQRLDSRLWHVFSVAGR